MVFALLLLQLPLPFVTQIGGHIAGTSSAPPYHVRCCVSRLRTENAAKRVLFTATAVFCPNLRKVYKPRAQKQNCRERRAQHFLLPLTRVESFIPTLLGAIR